MVGLWGLGGDLVSRGWVGLSLLPQAGIAMGTSLLAGQYLPEYRQTIITVAVSVSIVFELIGPPLTAMAMRRSAKSSL